METNTIAIYSIKCKENNRTYVGQAVDWYRRELQHRAQLNSVRHDIKQLQEDFIKYSEDKFEFKIEYEYDGHYNGEEDLLNQLDRLEVYYIEKLNAFEDDGGYNLTTGGRRNFIVAKSVRENIKEIANTPEFREHLKNIGGYYTEEGLKALKEKSTEYMNRPEVKQEFSERMTEYYKDPANRKKTSEATKAGMANLPKEKLSRRHVTKYSIDELLTFVKHTHLTLQQMKEQFNIPIALVKKIKNGKHWIYEYMEEHNISV